MTIDMSRGFHFRAEGLGLLLAWNDRASLGNSRDLLHAIAGKDHRKI